MTQTYTAADVRHLIPETLTRKQAEGVEAYLNEGKVPPADPCSGCDPNVIRKYINRIQHAERASTWPPDGRIDGTLNATREWSPPAGAGGKLIAGGPTDPEVSFAEVFTPAPVASGQSSAQEPPVDEDDEDFYDRQESLDKIAESQRDEE